MKTVRAIIPGEGFARNPLNGKKFRNFNCYCQSGLKVKKCCGLSLFIKKAYAEYLNHFLAGNIEAAEEVLKDAKEKGEI